MMGRQAARRALQIGWVALAIALFACRSDRKFETVDDRPLLPQAGLGGADAEGGDPMVIRGPGGGDAGSGGEGAAGNLPLDEGASGPDLPVGAALGVACELDSECQLGFCVDGVCCNTACGELCAACNLEGSEGTCSATPGDERCAALSCPGATDCRGVDSSQLGANCVEVGVCLEVAECETTNYEAGTPCENGTGTCDGVGACQVEGKLSLGEACAADDECAEGHCVATADGSSVCCDAGCDGLCQQCSAAGRCEESPAHDPRCPSVACPAPNVCRAYSGDLTENLCRGFGLCASESNCEFEPSRPAEQCTCDADGQCGLLQGNACGGDAECASGVCAATLSGERTCCATVCPAGFSCRSDGTGCEECSGNQRSCEGSVDARCEAGRLVRQTCEFGCSEGQGCNDLPGVGSACPGGECGGSAVCLQDADGTARCCVRNCAAEGRVCSESGSCVCPSDQVEAGGACQLRDGDPCQTPAQCESNACVDGVCCRDACDGACERCEAGTGACVAVAAGQQDAQCNGGRECRGDRGDCRLRLRESCDGDNAACASNNCEPSIAGGDRCCDVSCNGNLLCSADAQRCVECDAGNQTACDNGCNAQQGRCNPLRGLGTTCAQGRQCDSGLCLVAQGGGSRCCEANCAQQGKECNGQGRCVCPPGEQDQNGRCRRPNGDDCGENADCISGACETAVGQNQPVCCAESCNGFELCSANGSACQDQRGEAGARCNADADCQNGNCVTGVCCADDCGDCERCQLGSGRCEPAPSNSCTLAGGVPGDCNAQGQCEDPRQRPGQSCNGPGDCQAGLFCTEEGVCCRTQCNGACQQCGADGNCNVTPGRDSACGAVTCDSGDACVASTPVASFRRCASLGNCAGNDPADCSETPIDDQRQCVLSSPSAGALGVCRAGSCQCPTGMHACRATSARGAQCIPNAECCEDCSELCEIRAGETAARCGCDSEFENVDSAGRCIRFNGRTCNQPDDVCQSGNCMPTIRGFFRCCLSVCAEDELCNLSGACGALPGAPCERSIFCANHGFVGDDLCVDGVCL